MHSLTANVFPDPESPLITTDYACPVCSTWF